MRVLALFAAGFTAASAACVWGPEGCWPYWAAGACAAVFLLLLRFRQTARTGQVAMVLLAGLAIGCLRCGVYESAVLEPARSLSGTVCTAEGYVSQYVRQMDYGWQTELSCEEIPGRVILYCYDGETPDWEPGDLVTVTGALTLADTRYGEPSLTNFSQGKYLKLEAEQYTRLEAGAARGRFWPQRLARTVDEMLEKTIPEDALPFLQAMVTGNRELMWEDAVLNGAFARTGVSHMLSVSGMHVSVLATALLLIFGRNHFGVTLSALVSLGFAAMTGFSAPVVRALVMQVFLLSAPLFQRESDAPTSLMASLLLILGENPYAIASVSLQLSFLATLGLVWLAPHMTKAALEPLVRRRLSRKMPRLLWKLICFVINSITVSVSAIVMTAPVTALYFGSASLIAPIANLLLVPASEAAFCLAGASAALGAIWLPLGKVAGFLGALLVRYVSAGAMALSRFPLAAVHTAGLTVPVWLCVASLLLILPKLWDGKIRDYAKGAALGTVLLCVILTFELVEVGRERLRFTVLDVGQGQCVTAVSGSEGIVIDCGAGNGEGNAGDTAADHLQRSGVTRVSALVLTHYHDDHANGVEQLFARMPVELLVLPVPTGEDLERAEEILQLAKAGETGVLWITDETRFTVGSADVVLYPPIGGETENERCLAVQISAGEFSALVTGDMPGDMEGLLVKYYDVGDVTLLVVGHHGSKYAASQLLLDAVTPETAVISVGENRYGHPAAEPLQRLDGAGISMYRTDRDGTVTFRVR